VASTSPSGWSISKICAYNPRSDLRDPSTTPLNFTKSINLALSERGINAMRHAGQPKLIDHVMGATIPMRGRMIHGRRANGNLYEEPQDYDAHGRVCVSGSAAFPPG
jgi:kynurenine 3-monooxygenase